MQKNLRDQIIEGLVDGDTIEVLLRETNLTLATTVAKCRGQEAAKRQRSEMISQSPQSISTVQKAHQDKKGYTQLLICPGCGANAHQGGRRQCPAYDQACHSCQKTGHFAKVCRGRQARRFSPRPAKQPQASAKAIFVKPPRPVGLPQIHMPKIRHVMVTDPAPTIPIHISSLNGSIDTEVLPDSGADISAAGKEILSHLGEHVDNLLPSEIIPRAANGTRMRPIGKIAVLFQLGHRKYTDDLHIYPGVSGTLISWRAAKNLGILPKCYPYSNGTTVSSMVVERPPPHSINAAESAKTSGIPTAEEMMEEFPTVFDEQIRTMEGEEFHISLTDDAKPFCVNTPRSIPFAYHDKLKTELNLLESQGIIEPVTEATEWCAPIVVTPKKDTDRIRMCVDLSHLNRYVRRERYQSLTPAQAVADIAASDA